MDIHELQQLNDEFERQFPDLPTGGFYNPRLIEEYDSYMVFRCHYNNFDNDDDAWTWYWNKEDKTFSN